MIDDERSARNELIYQILHTMPESEISEADSGSSARALMSENDFDTLFVDIGLNDMEGTTLAAAARKLLPAAQSSLPRLIPNTGVRALELGGKNNYLLKPFDPARVHTVLEKCRRELEGEAAKAADTRQGREQLHTSRRLPVNINRTIVLLDTDQIVYIETLDGMRYPHHPQRITLETRCWENTKRSSPAAAFAGYIRAFWSI